MRRHYSAFLAIVTLFFTNVLQAQQPQQPPSPLSPPASSYQNDWIPRDIDALRQFSSSKTEFSFDHSMLVFASKLDQDNEDLRRVIAGVSGVSVHEFRFPQRWMYNPDFVNGVRDEYHNAGWKLLVNNHGKDGSPGSTDVWLRFENNAISNIALLFTRPNEVDFIVVNGSISPLDLTHLGGHFGIPKIEGGATIPNDRGRP
jgi:hypothetical protein